MTISGISGTSSMTMSGTNPFEKIKQGFDKIDSALQSGDLDTAKQALADIQKNAPGKAGDGKNQDIDNLSKALNSGDLSGAKDALSKIKDKMSQGPPAAAGGGSQTQRASGKTADTVQLVFNCVNLQ